MGKLYGLSDIFNELKTGINIVEDGKNLTKLFENTTNKIHDPLIANLFRSLTRQVDLIPNVRGLEKVRVGDTNIPHLFHLLQSGEIGKAFELASKNDTKFMEKNLTHEKISAYNEFIGPTPQKYIAKLEKDGIALKKAYEAVLNDFDRNEVRLAKLLEKNASHRKIKITGSGVVAIATTGTVLALTSSWLLQKRDELTGYWMYFNSPDDRKKIKRVKIQTLSCSQSGSSNSHTRINEANLSTAEQKFVDQTISNFENVPLKLLYIFENKSAFVGKIEEVRTLLGINTSDFNLANYKQQIHKHYDNLEKLLKDISLPIDDKICSYSPAIFDNGDKPICRLCDTSEESRLSTKHLSISSLPLDVTIKCIENPTLIDVTSDILQQTGVNIMEGVDSILETFSLKKWLFYLIGIVAIFMTCFLFIKYLLINTFKISESNQKFNLLENMK